uniref:Uncharacterized protein n=1 Tax=Arion vulgaris TaxID=1028688 RepID=A0A0B7AT25_9EUPU
MFVIVGAYETCLDYLLTIVTSNRDLLKFTSDNKCTVNKYYGIQEKNKFTKHRI